MLNESRIMEMGCVSQSLNTKQLQNLSITSLDTLELLSSCQWTQTQVTYSTLLLTIVMATRQTVSELRVLQLTWTWMLCFLQREAVLQGFVKRSGMHVAKLSALEMAGLGQFICGLQPNETEQLNTAEFKWDFSIDKTLSESIDTTALITQCSVRWHVSLFCCGSGMPWGM